MTDIKEMYKDIMEKQRVVISLSIRNKDLQELCKGKEVEVTMRGYKFKMKMSVNKD